MILLKNRRKIETCEQSSQQPSPPTPNSNKNISYTASPPGFPKAQRGTPDLRELETSEKHERVDDGRTEHGARAESACSPLLITPFIPAFLNN